MSKTYNIPVSLTINGSVPVYADSFDEAFDIVDSMLTHNQIDESSIDATDQYVRIDEDKLHECEGYDE